MNVIRVRPLLMAAMVGQLDKLNTAGTCAYAALDCVRAGNEKRTISHHVACMEKINYTNLAVKKAERMTPS
jgi:hypothetical protein